jgi:hypothetical protein
MCADGSTHNITIGKIQKEAKKKKKKYVSCHMSGVRCQVSLVTCQVSPVTCHPSPVTCHMSPVINANSHSHRPRYGPEQVFHVLRTTLKLIIYPS